jgi:mannan endo-1,4-beta-mannosidase
LGIPGPEGDRERLKKELDLLSELGINNLRILAASEQANHTRALKPSFMTAPGEINEDLLIGLDYLLAEMAKRDMKAVVFLNNMWEWSGGMTVYAEWFGDGETFDPTESGEWHRFQNLGATFYRNAEAQVLWREYITSVITRKNTITGVPNNEDPTIMSWQLANEPRPGSGQEALDNAHYFIRWIHESAEFISQLAPKQLVSSGNEGLRGSADSEEIYLEAHNSPHIDYLTFHMWAKNWSWIDDTNIPETIDNALELAIEYIDLHEVYAIKLNKPTVLSEFGFVRDNASFDKESSTHYRDRYLRELFALIESKMHQGSPIAGTNFWSWGGFGQAQHEDYRWRPGDPFTGDPPQEPQGLNSVFATDATTLSVLKNHADNIP